MPWSMDDRDGTIEPPALYGSPNPAPTGSPWQALPSRYADYISSTTLPNACPVVIIGTGLSGVSVAWHLLHRDPATEITLLEARKLCSAASGRNGGHLTCDLYGFAPALLAAGYTAKDIAEHGQFEIDNFNALSKLIDETGIACEFARKKHLNVCISKEDFEVVLHAVSVVKASRGPLDSVKVWSNPEASEIAGTPCYGLVEHAYSASVNPYKLVTGMLEILMERFPDKIKLYTNTLVTDLRDDLVLAEKGSIKCDNIILATNGYTSALLPTLKDVIVPVRGQVISELSPRRLQNYSFSLGGEYLSQRPDGSMVLGGGRRFASGQELHNANDATLSPQVSSFLHDHAAKIKIVESEGHIKEKWEWTGIMGFANLGIPLTMQLPPASRNPERARTFLIAGFTGHGMPRIYLSASHIADLVLQEKFNQSSGDQTSVPAGYEVIRPLVDADLKDR